MGQSSRSPNSSPGTEREYQPPDADIKNPNSAYQQSLKESTKSFEDPSDYPGFKQLEEEEFSRENGPPDDTDIKGIGPPTGVQSKDNRWHYDENDRLTTEQKARIAEEKSRSSRRGVDDAGRPIRASDPSYTPEELSGDTEQQTFRAAVDQSDGLDSEEVLTKTQGQATIAAETGPTQEQAGQERRIAAEVDQADLDADPEIGEAGSYNAVGGMERTGDSNVQFSETVANGPPGSQTIPGSHLQNKAEIEAALTEKGLSESEAKDIAEYVSDLDYIDTPAGKEPRGRGMDLATQERIAGEETELYENTQQIKEGRMEILRNTNVTPEKATELMEDVMQRRRDRSRIKTEIEAEGRDTVPGQTSSRRNSSKTPPSGGGRHLFDRSKKQTESPTDYKTSLTEASRTLGQLPDQLIEEYLDRPTRAHWESGDIPLSKIEKQWVDNLKRNVPNDLVEKADPVDPTKGVRFNTDSWSQSDISRFKESLQKTQKETVKDVVTNTETVRPETVDAVEPFSRHNIKGKVKHVQTTGIKDFRKVPSKLKDDPTAEGEDDSATGPYSFTESSYRDEFMEKDDGAGIQEIIYLENQQGDDLKVAVTKSTENPSSDTEIQGPYHHKDGFKNIEEGDEIEISNAHLYYYKVSERGASENSIFDSGGWTYTAITDREASIGVNKNNSDNS